MDREQHRIISHILFQLILFSSFAFSSCFLIKRNSEDYKKPLVKSINIDSNDIVTIILDNTNKSKRIGEIHTIDLYYFFSILEYEKNEREVIIKKDISDCKEKFTENSNYRIEINWFGGHLFLKTVFQNGQFTVLNESYTNGI